MTNPFELRYSIFHAAKDLLIQQHEANLAAWKAMDTATKTATDLAPKFPTMAEIIDKAIEINAFVSSNTEKELAKIAKKSVGIA
jgi:acyl-CoA reductase-like NAD-dependent aldehyde dehydrogenase